MGGRWVWRRVERTVLPSTRSQSFRGEEGVAKCHKKKKMGKRKSPTGTGGHQVTWGGAAQKTQSKTNWREVKDAGESAFEPRPQ